jgi:osmotically-inducible protein OsmY
LFSQKHQPNIRKCKAAWLIEPGKSVWRIYVTTAILTRTDGQIQADIIAELRWDSSVPGTEIGVAVKDGPGTVGIVLKKWRAEEDAQNVNGVIAVATIFQCA